MLVSGFFVESVLSTLRGLLSCDFAMSLIPTNIITGFLGVGKTTAITHLLNNKPAGEVWSVLVNEFGEIGIDGAMLKPLNAYVREVPGGCICCVAGLPMKIALNMLIANTKPDRIIIEPTGLGHPADIIKTLTGEYYDTVLDVRAAITLLDPRKLSDARYTENATFQDQLAVADVLVANKTDLCGVQEHQAFNDLLDRFSPPKQASGWIEQGQLEFSWLDLPRKVSASDSSQVQKPNNRLNPQRELYNASVALPEGKDFLRRENQSGGFYSCGWLFNSAIQFDFNGLFGWLTGLNVLRAKAVMNTQEGIYIFNAENGVLSVNPLSMQAGDEILDSRLEVIDDKAITADVFEKELLSTIVVTSDSL